MDCYRQAFLSRAREEIENDMLKMHYPFFGFYRGNERVVCFTEDSVKHDDTWFEVEGQNLLDETDCPIVPLEDMEIFAPDYDTIWDWYFGDIQ